MKKTSLKRSRNDNDEDEDEDGKKAGGRELDINMSEENEDEEVDEDDDGYDENEDEHAIDLSELLSTGASNVNKILGTSLDTHSANHQQPFFLSIRAMLNILFYPVI